MNVFTEEQVHSALEFPAFIESLREAFAGDYTMPPRQVLPLNPESGSHDAFAMLPSWNDQVIALKAFTYFPGNQPPHRSLYSKILVFDRRHGEPLALVDGASVTYWRTAGVSALAADYLARRDAASLFLLGTGNLALYLIRAHASVRDLKRVSVWGRNPAKAAAVVEKASLEFPGIAFDVATGIADACAEADIIVAATGSPDILVRGEWLRPGTHADMLGNHHADKRECDTGLVTRSRVYVDTRANCFREAGEILVPVSEGRFSLEDEVGELSELCRGSVPGRRNPEEITLFKSVGCALGDLTGALAVCKKGGIRF
jgi:1-pyrroline-2-carboxylate reductase [NAD(P)H]